MNKYLLNKNLYVSGKSKKWSHITPYEYTMEQT